jgi:methyl-accepting chemotaxis protein
MRPGDTRNEIVSEVQAGFGRAFMGFLWLNAGLVVVAGAWRGTLPLEASLVTGFVLAGVPTLLWWLQGAGGSSAVVGSTALSGLVALLVAAFRQTGGMSLQIDMHMYFFACMAICVGWLNWRAIFAFGLFVAAHHTLVALIDTGSVFPDGYTVGRLAIHAGIVALEGAVLVWIIRRLLSLMAISRSALTASQQASAEAERLKGEVEARAIHDARWREDVGGEAARLHQEVARLKGTIDDHLGRLNAMALVLSGMAGETMRKISGAEEALDQAAHFVEDVTEAASALADTECEISRKAQRTRMITQDAAVSASDTTARVNRLAEAARRITDVVKLIETVAAQTNLLALNATIEAARAGEAGKGFAIVAQEVKALAGETARSTADITALASSIGAAAREALSAVQQIEAVMTNIDDSTGLIASAIEEQGRATASIRENAVRMRTGTESVVTAIGSVTGAAAEASTAALEVELAARSLSNVMSDVGQRFEMFLGRVLQDRAAA